IVEAGDVGAGAEGLLARAAHDDGVDGVVVVDLAARGANGIGHFGADRVVLLGAVEDDLGQAFAQPVELHVLGHATTPFCLRRSNAPVSMPTRVRISALSAPSFGAGR